MMTDLATGDLGRVSDIVASVVEGMGYELVRLKMIGGARPTLQVMAERPDGTMNVDDCARLSRELSVVLDVEDPIVGEYELEVSSPGIDRPLTREKDFDRFKGFDAKIEVRSSIDGQKRFRGRLEGMEEQSVRLTTDSAQVLIPFAEVAKAKLVLTDELLKAHGAPTED